MKSSVVFFAQCAAIVAQASPGVNIGFNPSQAAQQAIRLSAHSWEYGTAAEALLEYYNSSLSVFSPQAFPNSKLPTVKPSLVPSLVYAKPNIYLNASTLIPADGAAGDPCSLGVSDLLIGQTSPSHRAAATRQANHLLYDVPRWPNGAISHREAYAELWSDFIYMAPPFLAYYAVATSNVTLMRVTVNQCGLYRQVLQPKNVPNGATSKGAWTHIAGPPIPDPGLWSTGNGWVALGMARVLATVVHWAPTSCDGTLKGNLVTWIGEVLRGAMNSPKDPSSGLLRNYLNDTSYKGETSGTSAITAAVYRLAVLEKEIAAMRCPPAYGQSQAVATVVTPAMLSWADDNRRAVAKHVNASGIAGPAVDPFNSRAYIDGSPEGESFLVNLFSAWRDCTLASICKSS